MDLAHRKFVELGQKLDSLDEEFEAWIEQSEPNQPLEKHNTQIRRIARQLSSLRESIRSDLKWTPGHEDEFLATSRDLEQLILAVHRIWEFFRSKLVTRRVSWFRPYLAAADEFAWSCYKPAQVHAAARKPELKRRKEPPLVFLNGGSSPFAMSRNHAYEAEHVPGERIVGERFRAVLKDLPIPVVGVPWFQVRHLPDALVIAHEVGHNVQDDFGLSTRLQVLLGATAIPVTRREGWGAWLDEIFADVYGTVAAGPAFAGALADFLAADRASIAREQRTAPNWGQYPTSFLRILLTAEVLDYVGFKTESRTILASWKAAYPTHAMPGFEADISHIVEALLKAAHPELDGKRLTEILAFGEVEQENARIDCERILTGLNPSSDDIRVLFAAARLAFEQAPEDYRSQGISKKVLDYFLDVQPKGYRGADRSDAEEETMAEYDRKAGHALFHSLFSALQTD